MRILTLAACAALTITITGCRVMMPSTVISGTILGAPFQVKTPQDQDLTGLKIVADKATNGTAHVEVLLESAKAHTNPDAVAAVAAGQAQTLGATANLLGNAANLVQGLAAAYQSAGLSALPKGTNASK